MGCIYGMGCIYTGGVVLVGEGHDPPLRTPSPIDHQQIATYKDYIDG